jgi:hypothetical protein
MIGETLNGFPSGHAQISLTLWIIIASWGKKKRYYCAAILISLLAGFSRVYLGVHFPTDLFGGWLLGALVLAGYFLLGDRLEAALARGGLRFQMISAASAAFIMILYRVSPELLMPGAVILGMGTGWGLTNHYLHFSAAKVFERRGRIKFLTLLVRFLLGITGTAVLFVLLGKIEPENDSAYYQMFYFLRFAILGFWVYTGAPWLFQRIGLAEKTAPAATQE